MFRRISKTVINNNNKYNEKINFNMLFDYRRIKH